PPYSSESNSRLRIRRPSPSNQSCPRKRQRQIRPASQLPAPRQVSTQPSIRRRRSQWEMVQSDEEFLSCITVRK
ncbi:hypothetical protein IWW34DRAFT_766837, partial [Fusarium oxysporum f. sp. albedinis]